jgi:hypothetical protein
MGETGRADLAAVGPVAAIGHKVNAELSLGRLDRRVRLPGGNMKTLRLKLEMVDQRFH